MTPETLNVILIVLVVLVGGYAVYQRYARGEEITAATVVGDVKAAKPLAQELIAVATIAVQSAEQLKRTGKLPSNDAAFAYALDFVKKWIPGTSSIDNKDIIAAIESAVLVASFMADQIPKKYIPGMDKPGSLRYGPETGGSVPNG